MSEQLRIFSDGGGERGSTAAGACIIDGPSGRQQFIVFLGAATNNEAEITAGLLAFSALRALYGAEKKHKVVWVCDSEYVLKSATEYIHNWQRNGWKTAAKKPVKNQGLWKAYLHLRGQYAITAAHVYGHTGHEENEACDSAATWARAHAYSVLAGEGEGTWITSVGEGDEIGWYLLDGRDFLAALRKVGSESPEDSVIEQFAEKIAELPLSDSPKSGTAGKAGSSGAGAGIEEMHQAAAQLQQAAATLRPAAAQSKQAATLLQQLEKLLSKFPS